MQVYVMGNVLGTAGKAGASQTKRQRVESGRRPFL